MKAKSAEKVTAAMKNPGDTLRELDRVDSEHSLLGFVKSAWKVLEPGQRFISGWAVGAVSEHLQAVTRGEIRRLVINVPPGCTKSMLTNVFWPAWEWGPCGLAHHRFISASYEKTLATRDLVRCRDLVRSEWYQDLWPMTLKGDENAKTHYENDSTGWRHATSVGSSITGWRADRFIIDDPHDVKSAESDLERATARLWMTETVPTRMNHQDSSAIVMIMQRLHEGDLSGLVVEQFGEEYTHLFLQMEHERKYRCYTTVPSRYGDAVKMRRELEEREPLPSFEPDPEGEEMYLQDPRSEEGELLWPARFSREAVDELKKTFRAEGGSYAEAGQLQQRPVPRGGGLFAKDQFQVRDQAPVRFVKVARGWDLAASTGSTSPFTSSVKVGLTATGEVWILDVERFRAGPGEVKAKIKATAERDGLGCPISIPQDPGQAGKAQKAELAATLHGYNVHFSPETGSKEVRAIPIASQVEAGNVYLVRAPWNDAFLAEAGLFPNSKFKDQVDATSRGYAHVLMCRTIGIATIPGEAVTL